MPNAYPDSPRNFRGRQVTFLAAAGLLLFFLPVASNAQGAEATVVVEVAVPDPATLDVLTSEGFIIDAVQDGAARVYATPEDLSRLDALHLSWHVTGAAQGLPDAKTLEGYHDYAAMTSLLESYADDYPNVARLESLGKSVQGRELWAMLITDNPDVEEDEPEFKYVGGIHGDEPVGIEMCLYFIDLLLNEYQNDSDITDLVNETAIWIVPMMNPDGRTLGRRGNASGVDLNRSFPMYPEDFSRFWWEGENLNTAGRPLEVQRIMTWTAAESFVLSANLHTGSLVVNYPYDDDDRGNTDSPTPDDLLFEDLSLRYAIENPPMYNSIYFPDGITNGAEWYVIMGGMQDWNYRYAACMEVTIELSDTKWPAGSTLPEYWADNEFAMLAYLEAVHIGIRGLVTDRRSDAPVWAKVLITGNSQPAFTDPDVGDYHRLLLPGTYSLTFSAPGYIPYRAAHIAVGSSAATRVEAALSDGDVTLDGFIDASDLQTIANAGSGVAVAVDADVDGLGVDESDLEQVLDIALLR